LQEEEAAEEILHLLKLLVAEDTEVEVLEQVDIELDLL
jgi:hypothetical protein